MTDLWTGESLECVNCGHDVEWHHTLLQGIYCCVKCSEDAFHEFVARKQPLMEVRPASPDYLTCDECTEVLATKLKLEQHKLQHKWQEEMK